MDIQAMVKQLTDSDALQQLSKKTGVRTEELSGIVKNALPTLLKGGSTEDALKAAEKGTTVGKDKLQQVITALGPLATQTLKGINGKFIGKDGKPDLGQIGDAVSGMLKNGDGKKGLDLGGISDILGNLKK